MALPRTRLITTPFIPIFQQAVARIPNSPRAWLRHTLPVNYTELQSQRVGRVRYVRGCLIDGLPFQFLTALKLALSDGLQCRLKMSASTKLNLKKQTIPSPTPKPQTKILWRVIAETSLPAAHSFSPSNSPIQNRACLSNISTSRAAYMDVQKQYPFETVAVCVLPNHIHAIWTLPPDDADYSLRWRLIKTKFSAHFPRAENLSASKRQA